MYAQAYPTASSPYSPTSPPDAYRSSPIQSRQAYAFSPPAAPPTMHGDYARQFAQGPSKGQPRANAHGGHPGQPRHKGTLAPGQLVRVGEQTIRIERYLSEGGYAHVYLTTSEAPIYPPRRERESKGRWGKQGYTQHCLKRIAFQDEHVWADVKKEIEVMKALPPNPHLTQYLGSSHAQLPGGGYEVYILMEFCSGGGIIDLLNKRLRDRLKEIEILNIFTDVCEAVAAMHALRQPLLHRDLKIENVLSSPNGRSPTPQRPTPLIFKLCDFGSTTFPATSPPSTKLEAESLALDLNKNTTLQYRSPEMVEPMLGLPVGLPSDVWALGVLLYKLCYYTTPFEEHGPLAIVNAKYTFPQYPVYSPRLQHLIASMLVEQPVRRPTVFEILRQAHEMSGTRPEVEYAAPKRSLVTKTAKPSTPTNLLDFTSSSPVDPTPVLQPSLASSVQPQRRGRPNAKSTPHIPQAAANDAPGSQASLARPSTTQLSTSQLRAHAPSPRIEAHAPTPQLPPQPSTSQTPTVQSPAAQPLVTQHSFKAPTPTHTLKSSRTDSLDAFGAPRWQPSPGPSQASSGFADSFAKTSPPRVVQSSSLRRSPTSVPDAELSFETRFPPIDSLSSDSAELHDRLISPIKSPDVPPVGGKPFLADRPSFMSNRTGGDLASRHSMSQGKVQPRSTHVTGTAFKRGELLTPGSVPISTASSDNSSVRQDYFPRKEASPLDLLTGDDGSMGSAPAQLSSQATPLERTVSGQNSTGSVQPASVQANPSGVSNSFDDLQPESASQSSFSRRDQLSRGSSVPDNAKRPVSMYTLPSSATRLSPPTSKDDTAERPMHRRKSSINDIVTRFETLNSAGKAQKPIVAAKPQALRKGTDISPVKAKPPKPIKPESVKPESAKSEIAKPHSTEPDAISETAKPNIVKPTAVRHGEAPQAMSWSKSSSGRSFPTQKATITPRQETESRGGSPDKQQSVNSLIARWNQGDVGRK